MDHPWATCPTCNKAVRLKPWLGTLHFCLTEEEAAQQRAMQTYAMGLLAAQRNFRPPLAELMRGKPDV